MVLLELQESVIVAKIKILVFIGNVFLNVKQIVFRRGAVFVRFRLSFSASKDIAFLLAVPNIISSAFTRVYTKGCKVLTKRWLRILKSL